jgi:hypothetical protein
MVGTYVQLLGKNVRVFVGPTMYTAAHNPHTRAPEIRIYDGFEGVPLIGKSMDAGTSGVLTAAGKG